MMERSSKFLSLSGLSGVLAGVYALIAAYIAYRYYQFIPDHTNYSINGANTYLNSITILALGVLFLSIGTAILFSYQKSTKNGQSIWNSASKKMALNMLIPLISGGILILIFISKDLLALLAPTSLLFYGIALYNASNYTFADVKYLGIIQIGLGLISAYYIEHSILLWAVGFGIMHIIYGIYIYYRYEIENIN
jgi:hypothetical protein